MADLNDMAAGSPVAPRTPKTEIVFNCEDETTEGARLELTVTNTALELAKSLYDGTT